MQGDRIRNKNANQQPGPRWTPRSFQEVEPVVDTPVHPPQIVSLPASNAHPTLPGLPSSLGSSIPGAPPSSPEMPLPGIPGIATEPASVSAAAFSPPPSTMPKAVKSSLPGLDSPGSFLPGLESPTAPSAFAPPPTTDYTDTPMGLPEFGSSFSIPGLSSPPASSLWDDDDEDWDDDEMPPLPELQKAGAAPELVVKPQPEQEEIEALAELPYVSIRRGELAREMVHSICSLNLKPNYDEISLALSVFSKLDEGEHGWIRFSVRPAAPEAASRIQTMFTSLSTGQPADIKAPWKISLGRWGKYFIESLSMIGGGANSKKGVAPHPPWKAPELEKPPAKYTMTEENIASLDFAREKVQARKYYEGYLHIGVMGEQERAEHLDEIVTEVMTQFNAVYSNGATEQGFQYTKPNPTDALLGLLPAEHWENCILSPPELGEMMKVPDKQTRSQAVSIERGHRIVPPAAPIVVPDLLNPPAGIIPFGEIYVGTSKQKVIGMPVSGLATHLYLCGTTGSGKSTLLESFIFGLVKQGKCIFLIDPHGTLVENCLPNILAFAPERADDILVLDFGDAEWPIAFNPIAIDSASEIEGTTNSVKEMILKMLNLTPEGAPRAVNYVEQAVWALCETNLRALDGHKHLALTLLQVPTFFTNPEFRALVMNFVTNQAIKENFYGPDSPFERMKPQEQLTHVMPVLRTFSTLGTKDSFSNIFGQSESRIDFAKWVREQKVVLMKLPAIANSDAAVATFIGAMVTPMLIGSLSKWANDPDLSAYLIIDEFQNYATESYKRLLAETRKYGLHAISANQVPQDLPPDVLRGIQSNTGSKISMRLDAQAVKLICDFIKADKTYPAPTDIVSLDPWWGWANIMMGKNSTSGPFVFKGLAPMLDKKNPLTAHAFEEGTANVERLLPQVMNASRLATAQPRDAVMEARIRHIDEARQVMERRIQDRARQGGFDGAKKDAASEALDNYWDTNH